MSDPIPQAIEVLRRGGLVAFPTETVYGLGADATNEKAVGSIFRVKGRPQTHPLIVHLSGSDRVDQWAREVSKEARLLMGEFWPGPLTIIVRKSQSVLSVVTGQQDTVGLRVPDHPLALRLLREFGEGIAAPSANRFGRVSPTSAEHVRADLGIDVDFILDGGPCIVGVESTIVDVSSGDAAILRPGGLTREHLEEVLRRPLEVRNGGSVRASGQLVSHYAPRAQVVIVEPSESDDQAKQLRQKGKQVVILSEAEVSAPMLYASLRRADEAGADLIVVPMPREVGLGLAVADRLRKAAGGR